MNPKSARSDDLQSAKSDEPQSARSDELQSDTCDDPQSARRTGHGNGLTISKKDRSWEWLDDFKKRTGHGNGLTISKKDRSWEWLDDFKKGQPRASAYTRLSYDEDDLDKIGSVARKLCALEEKVEEKAGAKKHTLAKSPFSARVHAQKLRRKVKLDVEKFTGKAGAKKHTLAKSPFSQITMLINS
ncbi:unnamed protein product [Cuscuta campestris]|uniref:Uncharacterized protein n=1 Tax=Cuscuta campestris TaxID=132261 RepID=A0A484NCW7_9ASTE|nr:unnamed protein product [Cuscuta campestris]